MTNKEALRRFKAVCKMCSGVDCDECKGKNSIDALERSIGEYIVETDFRYGEDIKEKI